MLGHILKSVLTVMQTPRQTFPDIFARLFRCHLGGALLGALALTAAGAAGADMIGHGGMVRAVAVSPDGARVLSGSFDYSAKLWDFVEQKEIGELNEHNGPVNAVAFLPDGRRALTASDDRTAILWDLKTLKVERRLEGHGHKVMAVAVSRDGRRAATGSWDRSVRIWDLAGGRAIAALSHQSPVNAVVFAVGGNVVVSGGHDGMLRAWSVPDGRPLGQVAGHAMGIAQLAVSADGRSLLSAGIDEKLKLWALPDLREVRTFSGHEGQIYGVAFSPDGTTALSSGRDGQVIRWDLATGKPIRFIRAHEKPAWAVAYTPDGRFALSASSDETVRVWHLETGDRIGIPAEGASEPKPWLTSTHPGAKLFRKCAICHSLAANRVRRSGPHFAGLFGRRAGSVSGYNYSRVLVGADFLWNEESLKKLFEQGPDVFLPGTKMPLQRIPNQRQLGELIGYLREITVPARGSGPGSD